MSVTIEDVRRVARLARLSFTDEEEKVLVNELATILEYMEQLSEVSLVGEMDSPEPEEPQPALRPDETELPISREDALKNAPVTSGEYFEVPKVIQ
ncbi:MAG: Asp-tRNA(Asn)/Glu-tRNA(Gln) amidotransferase subunit GatC [Rhodothermales bacterium]|nr:Asp-tRNA(Asn)/Glu-tRNA(Gln) amidotransferase subunit GatC [Rhodothermales bacterium]